MAIFANTPITRFCCLNAFRCDVTLEDIRDVCVGVGRDQCWRGGLWTILGVYQAFVRGEIFTHDDDDSKSPVSIESGSFMVDCQLGDAMHEAVRWAETKLDVTASIGATELQLTSLTNEQIATVEQHLVRVWYHSAIVTRRARHGSGMEIRDMASNKDVKVDLDREFLSFDDMREGGRLKFAMYLVNEGLGVGNRTAHTLTYVSKDTVDSLTTEDGEWGELVQTHYPIIDDD
ncbi:hypothetical protein F5B19DRAFT_480637 [Rostrohypoxylon terebratum]|nr:hypothetical protein F5B19DRAFT_480637 [Rostrohypoxylon terebratum]